MKINNELTEQEILKQQIKDMTHYQLANLWRFGDSSDPRVQGELGDYLKTRLFDEFGGFTPEISKELSND